MRSMLGGARLSWGARLAAALSLFLASALSAKAVDVDAAQRLVESTSAEIINLANGGGSDEQKRARFEALLSQRSDVGRIARLTVGRPWRQMSEAQRAGYRNAIIPYISARFVKNFNDFRGGTLKVRSVRAVTQGGEQRAFVQTLGKRATSAQGTDIEWVITELNGQAVILDVKVENLSLVITQRQEIGSILSSVGGDFDKLIAKLRAATARAS